MGHEVFVSYKYSDGKETKDKIMRAIGKSGHFYNGEKGFCKLEVENSTLKQYLADMIYGTTVTIVVISPNVRYSKWVDWEIQYSLETHTRNGKTNARNGIVCVMQSQKEFKYDEIFGARTVNNSNWAYNNYGCSRSIRYDILPDLIIKNMVSTFEPLRNNIGYLDSNETNINLNDYCIVVLENTFLSNPNKYINEAYARSNDYYNYQTKTRTSNW